MTYKQFIYIVILFVVLSACEHDKNPVYEVDLTPPEEQPDLEIELSHVLPNNTIYIYEYTKLTYKIDTKGKEILDCKISIDTEAEIRDNSIILYPLADNSTRKLIFDIQLKTNTGSIADTMGYERYVGKYEYDIKFVKLDENFKLNLRGGKSEDGYLQLNWDKPVLDNATLQKYELVFIDDITKKRVTQIITDTEQTNFVDKNYTWGYKTFELYAYYKNNDVDYESFKSNYFSPQYYGFQTEPKFNYEYLDNQWMNVSWSYTGYKCKYLVIEANGTKIECDENQRKVKMQRFRFPSDANRFKFYILPYNLPYEEYEKGQLITADMVWNDGRYQEVARPLAWNISKDEYYDQHYEEMSVYSISGFKKKKDYILREIGYYDDINIAASQKNSQVAMYIYMFPTSYRKSDIFIYNDASFRNPIKLENVNRTQNQIFLTDNYRLIYQDFFALSDVDHESQCVVLDSKTGVEIFRQKMQNLNSKLTVSSDGKYFCDWYKAYLNIYEIQDDKAVLIYTYTNNAFRYNTCQFSYINPAELILSGGNETIIFDVNRLSNKYNAKGLFIAQDPLTGNIACLDELFSQNSLLNVYDKNLKKVLTKIPFYHYNGVYALFNNRLIRHSSGDGSVSLDITNYIQ